MCWSFCGKADVEEEAYRIYRHDDSGSGYHDRRRSSVERHMNNAPAPIPPRKGKRYPKVHHNREEQYQTESTLYEYPTLDFPYSTQNYKGEGRSTSPGGTVTIVGPKYTRTITDRDKNIQGVSYHPYRDRRKFVRAEEIYTSGPSGSRSRQGRRH
ncbi:MAG: hypothetical protein Q9175_005465 [Cornicularia normoerica]